MFRPFRISKTAKLSGGTFIFKECSAYVFLKFFEYLKENNLDKILCILSKYVKPDFNAEVLPDILKAFIELNSGNIIDPFPGRRGAEEPSGFIDEINFIGCSYGLDPYSLIRKYSLRQVRLLFYSAYNLRIEDISLKIKIAGGKAKLNKLKLKRCRHDEEEIKAAQWKRAEQLARRRKEFYEKQRGRSK